MSVSNADDELSAVVSCVSAPDDGEPITACNVRRALPPDAAIDDLRNTFERAGFATTEPFAGAFSITAPRTAFVEVFAPDDPDAFSSAWFERATGTDLELPVPAEARAVADEAEVSCVVAFTSPPDFGPGNP
jgi:hypothetical protein